MSESLHRKWLALGRPTLREGWDDEQKELYLDWLFLGSPGEAEFSRARTLVAFEARAKDVSDRHKEST